MIQKILDFLTQLAANNDREWFNANKALYNEAKDGYIDIVQDLIDRMSLFDPELAGLNPKDCIFRIHRDIRFSPNKLPYKTHFGAYICSEGGRNSRRSGYYFHIEPGNCLLSGGLWMPDPKLLKRVRQDVYDHIEELIEILENPAFKAVYPGIDGETLKRIPQGFPPDFEHEKLLRHKDYCISAMLPDSFFQNPEWMIRAVEYFKLQLPFHRFFNYTVDDLEGRN